MTDSCVTCPSFLSEEEAGRFFKKSIGTPMCARYGHVLGKPGLKPVQAAKITEHFAAACPEFGQHRPIDPPGRVSAQVTIGDPTVQMLGESSDADRVRVSSCLECKHFVRPEAVRAELGWPSGLCAATGRLIMQNLLTREASNCEWRSPGANRSSTTGIPLMPAYEEASNLDADPISAFLRRRRTGKATFVDPAEYPTDKTVDPIDESAGIRAWRKIEDPSGSGRHTFLPVYSPTLFDEDEKQKIPATGCDEHPELYVDHAGLVYKVAIAWRELDETPALWGIAGTGKTELARVMAWIMQLPFDRISITAQTDVDDLLGKMLAADGSTFFQYGRLPRRWIRPGVIGLDEPNTGPDEVWQALRPLTDNSKQLVIDQNNGEAMPRHTDAYLMMMMNPAWDVGNVGANILGDADGNRLAHIKVDLPPEMVERAILEDRCALDDYDPSKVLDGIMKSAKEIRALSNDGTLPISWGIRPQVKVIRATRWFDILDAYKFAVADYLEPEQATAVLDVVRANFAISND